MKSAHSGHVFIENRVAREVPRVWWQYGLETVWAVGAGVMAARLLP